MDIIEQGFVLAIVCCSVPLVNQSLQKDLEHHLHVLKVGVLMALVGLRRGLTSRFVDIFDTKRCCVAAKWAL